MTPSATFCAAVHSEKKIYLYIDKEIIASIVPTPLFRPDPYIRKIPINVPNCSGITESRYLKKFDLKSNAA